MPKTSEVEQQLIKKFKKLSPEGKGEVLSYAKWMRDIESREKLRKSKNNSVKGQKRK